MTKTCKECKKPWQGTKTCYFCGCGQWVADEVITWSSKLVPDWLNRDARPTPATETDEEKQKREFAEAVASGATVMVAKGALDDMDRISRDISLSLAGVNVVESEHVPEGTSYALDMGARGGLLDWLPHTPIELGLDRTLDPVMRGEPPPTEDSYEVKLTGSYFCLIDPGLDEETLKGMTACESSRAYTAPSWCPCHGHDDPSKEPTD